MSSSAHFNADIFKRRRAEFMKRMVGGVAVIPAQSMRLRNGDVYFEYRQDSDFFYLTGFEEPGSLAILTPGHAEHKFVLFVPPRDKTMEIWNGRRAGPEGAKSVYGADAAFAIEEIEKVLPDYVKNNKVLYVHLGDDDEFEKRVMGWLNKVRAMKRQGHNAPTELHDPSEILHEMRLIKNDDDLGFMRAAGKLGSAGHRAAMAATRPGMFEYQVQAEFEYACKKGGSQRLGYPSIVASGDNANILHYHENNMVCKDGDLILMDAGCEVAMYTSDITRCWPVNGKFSAAQKEVYEWVLKAQLASIDKCRPGVPFMDVHWKSVEVLTEGMVAMGLLKGDPKKIIADQKQWDEDVKNKKKDPKNDKAPKSYREFYMHNTSHWLGMDVHDVGVYRYGEKWRELAPGCVLTVEPGIYIAAERDDVPAKYKGIGVRIEDDVLVTKGDPEVLTKDAPKTVSEIEAVMAAGARELVGSR
ncbi:MAG: aminopeptidase P N-terminal domain-containing protein [Planctomycetes bacterium]|nr:aminopeptidase P N-terminal domain-containing protein [Planctomycetota bacterium]